LLINSQIYHVANNDVFIETMCQWEIPPETIRELSNKMAKSLELRSSR